MTTIQEEGNCQNYAEVTNSLTQHTFTQILNFTFFILLRVKSYLALKQGNFGSALAKSGLTSNLKATEAWVRTHRRS